MSHLTCNSKPKGLATRYYCSNPYSVVQYTRVYGKNLLYGDKECSYFHGAIKLMYRIKACLFKFTASNNINNKGGFSVFTTKDAGDKLIRHNSE